MYISFIRSLLLLFITATCINSEAGKHNISLNAKLKITLVQNGKSRTVIVVPENSCKTIRFAAKELQNFLQQSFNDKIPIVSVPDKQKTSIILGNNVYSRKAGINIEELPRDGFIIRSIGKTIYIAGKDDLRKDPEKAMQRGAWIQLFERGTLFGVYDFLERFVGVRFFFPGSTGTVVPKYENLKITAMNITESPDYTERKISWFRGQWYEGKDREKFIRPEKNLNYYRLRMSTQYIPNCHGLARLGYLGRFGKTHPEYFALMTNGKRHNNPSLPHPGQLCFSSKVREQVYKDAEAFLSGKSAKEAGILTERFGYCWEQSGFQPGYFNIMPQDGFYQCKCPECQKYFAKSSQAASDFIWQFVREVALKLKKNNIPGYLTMMAYPPYRDLTNVEIPDNVLVMVSEHGPWGIYNRKAQDKDNEEIKVWANKMGRKIWLWNYANKYGKRNIPGIPSITPNAIGNYYKKQKPYIFGAYMQSNTDKYIFNVLNYYIFSKVCWNNDVNIDDILNEYYTLMFGPAATTMKNIDRRAEDLWLRQIGGRVVDTPLGPIAAPPSEYELWENIYSAEEIKKFNALFDKAEKQTGKNKKALERVKFFRREVLDGILQARNKYFRTKKEIEDLYFYVKPLAKGKKLKIDGKLDEASWEQGKKIYLHPYKGNPKELKTVNTLVYALRDNNYLYFGIKCEEPAVKNMLYIKRKQDDKKIYRDSSIELFLNPSGDRKNYYQIIVNPAGSFTDLKGSKVGQQYMLDRKWNSNAIIKTALAEKSWSVEIAVPLKSLDGFKNEGFPANFNRNRILDKGKGYVTLYTWSPFLKYGFHDLLNFGSIVFKKNKDESILKNGDFSVPRKGRTFGAWTGLQKKQLKPGQSVNLDKSTFVKGRQSLKLVNTKDNKRVLVTQFIQELKPDTKYLLTFYIKTDNLKAQGGRRGGAVVNIYDDKNRWFPKNWFLGNMPWNKQGFEFTTGHMTNKKRRSYIRLYITGAAGSVWFDDLRLREIKE